MSKPPHSSSSSGAVQVAFGVPRGISPGAGLKTVKSVASKTHEDFLAANDCVIKDLFSKKVAYDKLNESIYENLYDSTSYIHSIYYHEVNTIPEQYRDSFAGIFNDIDDYVAKIMYDMNQWVLFSYIIAERFINKGKDSRDIPFSPSRRLDLLKEYVDRNGAEHLDRIHRILFPEAHSETSREPVAFLVGSLPESAPLTWKADRLGNESPPGFIQRVYGQWMGKGLTVAEVRRRDEPLAQAYYYHVRKGRPLPEGFDLPSKPEQNTRWLERIGRGEPVEGVHGPLDEEAIRAARRLDGLRRQRKSRASPQI